MAVKRDYYEVLGVSRDASQDEVRRAFRRLARQYHPDVNKDDGAATRFKEINEAYEVLSDAEKRRQYDRFGHAGVGAAGAGFGAAGAGFGIEDIFETFFGATTRTSRRPTRGADLRYDLEISFEEAVFGTTREIEVPKTVVCPRCSGDGAEPGSPPQRCPTCGGSGEIRRAQQSIFGQFVNVMVCDRCRGSGQIITKACAECHGRGTVQHVRKIPLTIPAGVDDGQQMQVPGEGELGGRGGPPGDLYVFISVKPHPQFKRQNYDLIYDVGLDVASAALGDEIDVPTLEGPTKLKVPPGTQHGKVLRVRGKGVPHLRGSGRGDLQVRIHVNVPQSLTDEQRELFERLRDSLRQAAPRTDQGANGRHNSRGSIFDRVKDVLGGD
ncbi:MAG TPA: molecular chaperone DnaJ [Chloroflexota bacterium]|nr:molecular chaperone DnaJ [Chloroflexota bacterium]